MCTYLPFSKLLLHGSDIQVTISNHFQRIISYIFIHKYHVTLKLLDRPPAIIQLTTTKYKTTDT